MLKDLIIGAGVIGAWIIFACLVALVVCYVLNHIRK